MELLLQEENYLHYPHLLGFFYGHGIGTLTDSEKSYQWYKEAAKKNMSIGEYQVAYYYDVGNIPSIPIPDHNKAYQLWQESAKLGSDIAQISIGWCYTYGAGISYDLNKGLENLRAVALRGNPGGMFYLASWYGQNRGNWREEFEWCQKAAKGGHWEAQLTLGMILLKKHKFLKASFWLQKAAENACLKAETVLASIEKRFKNDNHQAIKLLRRAHIDGDSEFSKVADFVNNHLVYNQKTPKDLFNCLNNKSPKRSIDNILFSFCLEHGIGTIPNLTKAFLEFQKAASAEDSFEQFFLGYCYNYNNRIGTSQDRGKAFELYSKSAEAGDLNAQYNPAISAEAGHVNPQYNLAVCYDNGSGTTKNEEKTFELYSKAAEAGHFECTIHSCTLNEKNEEKAFELYSKAAEAGSLIAQVNLLEYYRNRLETTKDLEKVGNPIDQDYLKHFILQFQNRGFKYPNNLKGEFSDFEAFFDQLSDEFKCFKCGNLGIIINGSPICPFCDTDNSDDNVFEAGLPKYLECYSALKDPVWCNSCESLRFLNIWGTWNSGNNNIDQYIVYTQRNSENCRGCLEWISPKDIIHLDQVGAGGFGIVKEGTREPQSFLKSNEDIFTWDMFHRILFQITGGLRFMHESELLHGDLNPGNILVLKTNPLNIVISDLGLCRPADDAPQSGNTYGVLEYLAPEICKGGSHTKESVLQSKKHTPQCIQEMIEKNWHCDPQYSSTAEELQQRVIAARDNCNLNELVRAQHDATRYKSQLISNFTCSMSGKTFIYHI
ncbi:hypothetical protein G9A89_003276 [Geosiphon pyriformis]|nr:hypothetical protein G9A89_003276 [Geosiphon pyriformis]